MKTKYWLESKIVRNSFYTELLIVGLILAGSLPQETNFLGFSAETLREVRKLAEFLIPLTMACLQGNTVWERMQPTIRLLYSEKFLPGMNKY